jgi:hypothetical protein
MAVELELAITVGLAITLIFIVFVDVQPNGVEAVTVYTVLDNGVTVIDAPVNGPGVHVYVENPPAVNVTLDPAHNVLLDATAVNVGLDTITGRVFILVHPKALIPVTVYVVVTVGVTTTGLLVDPPGFQV